MTAYLSLPKIKRDTELYIQLSFPVAARAVNPFGAFRLGNKTAIFME